MSTTEIPYGVVEQYIVTKMGPFTKKTFRCLQDIPDIRLHNCRLETFEKFERTFFKGQKGD